MLVPTEQEVLGAQLVSLSAELDRRVREHERLAPYDEGGCPIPQAIVEAKLQKAYRNLMPTSEAPWGSLVVDSVQDRLEVAGIRDVKGNEDAADAVWGLWQDNGMDSESKLAHRAALLDGRAFALVWPGDDGTPEIHLDDATQMVVQYRPGSRRHRVAALRRWREGDRWFATLYRPDGLYKFQSAATAADASSAPPQKADGWERREVRGEAWPLPNPYDVVPVVEIAVNRRLKAGEFGFARGEYAHCTGLIDRINLLTFLGMVVAVWMGFPLRGVTGDKIRWLKDDDGKPLLDDAGRQRSAPPFEARPDSVAQFENPDAKVWQLPAADRKNLSVFAELDQLAVITKTPRHYFPLEQGMSNLSADAIRASEGGLHAKTTGHKASLGEGWEEVQRLGGLMLADPVRLSARAELLWKDHESRSLAERADAATKLASINGLPWQYIVEKALNATGDEIARLEGSVGGDALLRLVTAARTPTTAPAPAPAPAAANGNGTR